jgi:hypothetical protein
MLYVGLIFKRTHFCLYKGEEDGDEEEGEGEIEDGEEGEGDKYMNNTVYTYLP